MPFAVQHDQALAMRLLDVTEALLPGAPRELLRLRVQTDPSLHLWSETVDDLACSPADMLVLLTATTEDLRSCLRDAESAAPGEAR